MNAGDPNVQRVELVAAALDDLCAELVLVGGCAASLLIDAPTAPPQRVTYDVDLGRANLLAIEDLIARLVDLHQRHPISQLIFGRGHLHDDTAQAALPSVGDLVN